MTKEPGEKVAEEPDRITPQGPHPIVWGLDLDQQASMVAWLFLIGEVSFLIAIYVLGADWWDKFRRLFVWEAPEG